MKIDPYKHKEKYLQWKDRNKNGIFGISPENSEIILAYLNDMERGANVANESVKGARSFNRLNTLRDKLCFFAKHFKEKYNLNKITEISEEQIISFFANMKNGTMKKADGGNYNSVDTYGKVFKAFWHWWQKVNKKRGIE